MNVKSIQKNFKQKYHKMNKKDCVNKILPKVQNTKCTNRHNELPSKK